MGKSQRDKGARFEREMVLRFNAANESFAAKRVPLSGAGWIKGDIEAKVRGRVQKFELKKRAAGFKQLYDWLGEDNFGLIVAADRRPALVVTRFDDFAALAVSS